MLPNVWSVETFKSKSNKTFSSRSPQLQAIDRALAKAHAYGPTTDAGVNAMIELVAAIATWRQFKAQQGKTSGRARAVDELHAQLGAAAESIYKRKIAEQKTVDRSIATAKATVQQDLRNVGLMQGKVKAPVPNAPTPPKAPAPQAPTIPKRDASQDRLFDHLAQAMIDRRRKVMAYDDEDLFDDLDAAQKGRLAARWMLNLYGDRKSVV